MSRHKPPHGNTHSALGIPGVIPIKTRGIEVEGRTLGPRHTGSHPNKDTRARGRMDSPIGTPDVVNRVGEERGIEIVASQALCPRHTGSHPSKDTRVRGRTDSPIGTPDIVYRAGGGGKK